jgi:hypothetical protein
MAKRSTLLSIIFENVYIKQGVFVQNISIDSPMREGFNFLNKLVLGGYLRKDFLNIFNNCLGDKVRWKN